MESSISANISGRGRRAALLLLYAGLTWAFCGAFLVGRGLWGETVFYELSQTRTWWQGFIYPYAETRPLMTVPYQIAYLLSNGSYGTMNVLFVLSVFATGLATHEVVRELMPESGFLAAIAGGIAIARMP